MEDKDIRVVKSHEHQSRMSRKSEKFPNVNQKSKRSKPEERHEKVPFHRGRNEKIEDQRTSRIVVSKKYYTNDLQSDRSKEVGEENLNVNATHRHAKDSGKGYRKVVSSERQSSDEQESDSDVDSDYTIEEVNSKHESDSDSVYSVEFKNIGGTDDEMSNSGEEEVAERKDATYNDTRQIRIDAKIDLKKSNEEDRIVKSDVLYNEVNKRSVSLKKHDNDKSKDAKIIDVEVKEIQVKETTAKCTGDGVVVKMKETDTTKCASSVKNIPNDKIQEASISGTKAIVKTVSDGTAEKKTAARIDKSSKEILRNSKSQLLKSNVSSESNQAKQESKTYISGDQSREISNNIREPEMKKTDQRKQSAVLNTSKESNEAKVIKNKENEAKTVDSKKDDAKVRSTDKIEKNAIKTVSKSANKLDTRHQDRLSHKEKKESTTRKNESKHFSKSRSVSSDSSCSTCSSSSNSDSGSQYSDSDSESNKSSDSGSESDSESSSDVSSSSSSESESESENSSSSSEDNFKRKKRMSDSRSRRSPPVRRGRSRSPYEDKYSRYRAPLRAERRDVGRFRDERSRRGDGGRIGSRERSRERYRRERRMEPRRKSRSRSYERSRRRSRSKENLRKDYSASRQRFRSPERQRSDHKESYRSTKDDNRRNERNIERPRRDSEQRPKERAGEVHRRRSARDSIERKDERDARRKSSPVKKDASTSRKRSNSGSRSGKRNEVKATQDEQGSKEIAEKHASKNASKSPAVATKEQDKRSDKPMVTEEHEKTLQNEVSKENKVKRITSQVVKPNSDENDANRRDDEQLKDMEEKKNEKESKKEKNKPKPLMEITLTGLKRPIKGYDRHSRKVNVTKKDPSSSTVNQDSRPNGDDEKGAKRIRRNVEQTVTQSSNENKTHIRRLSSGKTLLLERNQLPPLMKQDDLDFITSNDRARRVVEVKNDETQGHVITRRVVTESKPKEIRRSIVTTDDGIDSNSQPKRKIFSRLGRHVVGKSKNIAINLKAPPSKELERSEVRVEKKGEEDLDSRIQQIREKNEAILRRQKEIEEDIKFHA
eukprot:gene7337-8157_t